MRPRNLKEAIAATTPKAMDAAVMARLRAPFGYEYVPPPANTKGHFRIHDANDDAIASVSGREEGYARKITRALNRTHPLSDRLGGGSLEWIAGFGLAVAEMLRRPGVGEDAARSVLHAAGFDSIDLFVRAELDKFDLEKLRPLLRAPKTPSRRHTHSK
jgi:hypothetical protein